MAADGSFSLSIFSGIMHPLTGFDHLMLALGMGMLFTQMHSFKKGFVALLIGLVTGFVLSLSVSLNSVFIEYGILLSIVLLTMALMSRYFNVALNQNHEMSVKTVYKSLVIGFGALAMFHGAAHAIEVPANSNTAGFFTGMYYCHARSIYYRQRICHLSKHSPARQFDYSTCYSCCRFMRCAVRVTLLIYTQSY